MSDLLNSASLVMIPSGYKEDVVYSQIPTDGSGDLSFTRASNGTRVNSAGLVEDVAWNLAQYSEDFSNAVWSIQGSSISSDSTTAPNGTTTADTLIESNTTDEHNRFQELNIGTGEFTYSIYLKYFNTDYCALYVFNPSLGGVRYWVNVNTLTAGTSANIGSGIGTTSLSLASVGSGWVRASITFTNPSGVCRFYVANAQSNGGATTYAGNGTSGVYIWGAQLNIGATAKPYFPTTDRLNVPRLTYQNGGGGCPSLLLEKQSTNLILYSEDLTQSNWTKANASITANNTTSPDGTQNADKIVEDTANSTHGAYQAISVTDGIQYTWSGFFKAAGRTKFRLFAQSASTPYVEYDLSNGTIFSITGSVTPTIESVGNGWYKCTATSTTSGTTAYFNFATLDSSNNVSYTGDGTSGIFVWGAQLEASSYPTSYIPTTSASATRVVDTCFKTGISSLIGQTEGVIFVDLVMKNNISSVNRVVSITESSWISGGSIRIDIQSGNIAVDIVNGGVTIGTISVNTPFAQNTRYKIALAYKTNDCALYMNGTQLGTNTSVGTMPTCSEFYLNELGGGFGGPWQPTEFNQAVLFKTRLTNAELASLTTI
jgi:hypothetical protein